MDDFDFEGPSFSLGIDLDDDEPNHQPDLVVADSDPDPDPEPEPTADEAVKQNVRRRRLRLASTISSTAPVLDTDVEPSLAADWKDDDDIEDFSTEDEFAQTLGEPTSAQYQAVCSTSKASLPAQGSVVVKPFRKLQSDCQNEEENSKNNPKGETSGDKIVLPKLTVSPLRKFQLIDSDSDDFLDDHEVHMSFVKQKNDSLLKTAKACCGQGESYGKRSVKESSTDGHRNEDLWKDFLPPKSFNISTPVLDEVCEEYFQTLKKKVDGRCPENASHISDNGRVTGNTADQFAQNLPSSHSSIPPAHRYFFHIDNRIQNLVRSRLHNFHPLEILDNPVVDQFGEPNIDYRSQFDQGGTSTSKKQLNRKTNVEGNSTILSRKKKSTVERVSQVSENWVNPRVSARDAGQKRVRADGSSNGGCPNKASPAGRWFTGSDGKRVYVNANGQELTGRLAYMNYKKESGGLKKSRKKPAAKKK